jgi:periplasmic protein TonB
MQTSVYARGAVEIDQAWSRVLASLTVVALHATAFALLLTQVVVPIMQAPTAPEETVIETIFIPQPKAPEIVTIKTDRAVERPAPERIVVAPSVAINTQVFEPIVSEESWAAETSTVPAQTSTARPTGNDREASADTTVERMGQPTYPLSAIRAGLQGTTLLRVTVNRDGQVVLAHVQEGSGHTVLDQAAIAAVRKWRFNPAIRDGMSVESTVLVPFEFSIVD